MIVGIGLDIVDIERIKKAYQTRSRFAEKILTVNELELFHQYSSNRQITFLAGRFAAKEAYAKAVGTGIGQLRFTDIDIQKGPRGEPFCQAPKLKNQTVYVSITHTDTIAVAQVIIEQIPSQ